MRRPFVWFLASLAIGIVAARYMTGLYMAAVFAAVTLAAVFAARREKIYEPLYMPFLMVLGIVMYIFALSPKSVEAQYMVGKDIYAVGTVREHHTTDSGRTAVTLDCEYITDGTELCGNDIRICAYADYADVSAGDKAVAYGRLYSFEEPTNPYQTDYRMYMLSNGFDYSMNCESIDKTGVKNSGLVYKIEGLREYVNDFLDKRLPKSEAGIAKALTTGYKYDVDENTKRQFRNMGISHVLAISGLHVSVITGFIFYIFTRLLGMKKRRVVPAVSVFLVVYLLFTGMSPSAIRAVIMAITAFTALMLYKNSDRYNTIAFSAFIMLFINPLYLWNVSFQLSYLGITAVAVAMELVNDMGKAGKLSKSLMFAIVVWIITAPTVMYYFGGISLLSVISNMIAVPYLSLVTSLTLPTVLLSFFPFINSAAVIDCMLKLYIAVVGRLDTDAFYMVTLKPPFYAVIIVYLFISGFIYFRKNRKMAAMTAAVFALAATSASVIRSNERAEIVFFDSGQGDASAIYIPGELTAVIDCGPDGGAEKSVIPYVKAKSGRVDLLFITHMDADHLTGAFDLIDDGLVSKIIVSDAEHTDDLAKLEQAAQDKDIPIFYASCGDSFETESCTIDCLYPFNYAAEDENSTSLVLKATVKNTSVLFTGDISADDEAELLDSDISCDILKVAHHGSDTASSERFIKAAGAMHAVIEAAKDNIYGFPSEEVTYTLENNNVHTYVTGYDGAITAYVDSDGYEIKTFCSFGGKND